MTTTSVLHREDHFVTGDAVLLYEQSWLPGGEAQAHIALVHGYAEHSGRYAYTGEALAGRGFAVHALDLRGHGRSDGDRVYIRSFNEYLRDARAFLRRVDERAAGKPVFLLGHSLGGAIVALLVAVDRPRLRGTLLSGPAIYGAGTPAIVRAITQVLGRLAPRLPTVKLNAAEVSRDAGVVARYESDPLVYHGRVRAGLAAALGRAISRIDRDAPGITLPLLIMHGAADALADPQGSVDLYASVGSADKTLNMYDGLAHEILNEPERDQVIADIASWLDARL